MAQATFLETFCPPSLVFDSAHVKRLTRALEEGILIRKPRRERIRGFVPDARITEMSTRFSKVLVHYIE